MSYTYADRKRINPTVPQEDKAPSQPSMETLRSGAAKPTQEQMGRRVDLPDAMRSKMEDAFGADLSAVKLYESEAVSDAGAKAITMGSSIAFAPGMLDFTSYGGQALLGHELSHVVSQARGEVAGGGFLNDVSLEARADREGAMAAAGQTIAPPTAALSPVTAADAAGPMQADKKERNNRQAAEMTKNYDTWKSLEGSLTGDNAAAVAPQVELARAAFMQSARDSSRGARGILNERLRRSQESLQSNAAARAARSGLSVQDEIANMAGTPMVKAVNRNKDLVDWVAHARRGLRG